MKDTREAADKKLIDARAEMENRQKAEAQIKQFFPLMALRPSPFSQKSGWQRKDPANYTAAIEWVQKYEAQDYKSNLWFNKELPERQEEPMEIGLMAAAAPAKI